MNWWVIIVETCLNSLDKWLYIFVCCWIWIVVVVCEVNEKIWVFGEKWIWWWFWYEMRLRFHVCKCFDCLLNNKVWGMNLAQRGSKLGFCVKNWMGFRKETQNLGGPVWCNSLGELKLPMASFSVQHPWFWVFWEIEGRSGLS